MCTDVQRIDASSVVHTNNTYVYKVGIGACINTCVACLNGQQREQMRAGKVGIEAKRASQEEYVQSM